MDVALYQINILSGLEKIKIFYKSNKSDFFY